MQVRMYMHVKRARIIFGQCMATLPIDRAVIERAELTQQTATLHMTKLKNDETVRTDRIDLGSKRRAQN